MVETNTTSSTHTHMHTHICVYIDRHTLLTLQGLLPDHCYKADITIE